MWLLYRKEYEDFYLLGLYADMGKAMKERDSLAAEDQCNDYVVQFVECCG
ncbi:hypothetical protein [Liquorilactobacillus mali]|nr:hypothetical protein [Liquorilactobacillus mali]